MASDPRISDAPIHLLIDDYYAKKPSFTKYIGKSKKETTTPKSPQEELQHGVESLPVDEKKSPTEAEKWNFFHHYGGHKKTSKASMPVHPAEENASGNITDQVAKDSSDSTASSAPLHKGDTKATSGGSVGANIHKAAPGPVVAENIGEPASKEELKKRAEELNK